MSLKTYYLNASLLLVTAAEESLNARAEHLDVVTDVHLCGVNRHATTEMAEEDSRKLGIARMAFESEMNCLPALARTCGE